jgi:hypothetical protein
MAGGRKNGKESGNSVKIAPNLPMIVPKDLPAGQILGLFVRDDQ